MWYLFLTQDAKQIRNQEPQGLPAQLRCTKTKLLTVSSNPPSNDSLSHPSTPHFPILILPCQASKNSCASFSLSNRSLSVKAFPLVRSKTCGVVGNLKKPMGPQTLAGKHGILRTIHFFRHQLVGDI